jgi:hypothetical protein
MSPGEQRDRMVKNTLWMLGGLCAASVCFLVWGPKRTQSVELLADRPEEAHENDYAAADTL